MGICCGKTQYVQSRDYEKKKEYESSLSWLDTPSTSSASDKQNTRYDEPDDSLIKQGSLNKVTSKSSNTSSSIISNIKSSSTELCYKESQVTDESIERKTSSTANRNPRNISLLIKFKPGCDSIASPLSQTSLQSEIDKAIERITKMDSVCSFFEKQMHSCLNMSGDKLSEGHSLLDLRLSDVTLHDTDADSQADMKENVKLLINTLDEESVDEMTSGESETLSLSTSESSETGSYFQLSKDIKKVIQKYKTEMPFCQIDQDESRANSNIESLTFTHEGGGNGTNQCSNICSYLRMYKDEAEADEKAVQVQDVFSGDPPQDSSIDLYKIDDWLKDLKNNHHWVIPKLKSYYDLECGFKTSYSMGLESELTSPTGFSLDMREEFDACMEILRLEQSLSYMKLDDICSCSVFDLQNRIRKCMDAKPIPPGRSSTLSPQRKGSGNSSDSTLSSCSSYYHKHADMEVTSPSSSGTSSPSDSFDYEMQKEFDACMEIIRLEQSLSYIKLQEICSCCKYTLPK